MQFILLETKVFKKKKFQDLVSTDFRVVSLFVVVKGVGINWSRG